MSNTVKPWENYTTAPLQKRWTKATLSLRIVDLVKGGGTSPVATGMAARRHGMTLQLHILEDLFFIHFFGGAPEKMDPMSI